jgi:hypothetical protein
MKRRRWYVTENNGTSTRGPNACLRKYVESFRDNSYSAFRFQLPCTMNCLPRSRWSAGATEKTVDVWRLTPDVVLIASAGLLQLEWSHLLFWKRMIQVHCREHSSDVSRHVFRRHLVRISAGKPDILIGVSRDFSQSVLASSSFYNSLFNIIE